MDNLNPDQLARLRELLAKATPGPWEYRPQEYDDWGFIRTTVIDEHGWHPVVAVSRGEGDAHRHRMQGTDPYEPNGQLVVAAVNALSSLLDTLTTLSTRVEAAERMLQVFVSQYEQDGTSDEARSFLNIAYLGAKRFLRQPVARIQQGTTHD